MTLRLTPEELESAAGILRTGGTVAFPTETVYGLGADATNTSAIERVFAAKGRPSDNPLIVHLHSFEQLDRYCDQISVTARALLDAFCPGPLTLVLPKKSIISDLATAGLSTVAVRFPANEAARSLLRQVDLPIAAPSANRSGRPSATTWQAVIEDLDDRIDAVICDQPCRIGLESTVVDVSSDVPILLRSGGLGLDELSKVVPSIRTRSSSDDRRIKSPGLKHRHYQPKARVRLCCESSDLSFASPRQRAFIGMPFSNWSTNSPLEGFQLVLLCHDKEEYAQKLFDFFRRCDAAGIEEIWCRTVDEVGLGSAINDRLQRAADTSGSD
jgi:L-threonylcarbamoyladenylate synthase